MSFDPTSDESNIPLEDIASLLYGDDSPSAGESSHGLGYTNSVPTWNASGVRIKLEEDDGSLVIPRPAEMLVLKSCVKKEAEYLREKFPDDDDPPLKFRTGKRAKFTGASLCSEESVANLRSLFRFPEGVELVVPSPEDRCHRPPPGCFTVFESYFDTCFLTFPIPSLVLQFLAMHSLAMGQISPRGLRILVGIITLCLERDLRIGVWHLMGLLEIKPTGVKKSYYITPKSGRMIFAEHPSKDESWRNYFFFVKVNTSSVDPWFMSEMITQWSDIGS